jgi:hypothetical protein
VGFDLATAKMILDALTAVERIESKIDSMGVQMATAAQQLTDLKAQFADTTSDVLAKLDQLTQQLGQLDPAAQATLDEIKAGVQQLDDAVGDADGSDTPPPAPGE